MKHGGVAANSGGSFNLAALYGVVSSEVRVSELPRGGVVHNLEVVTGTDTDRHVVPVAWHDPVRPPRLRRGDAVVVVGVVRRRWYRNGGASQSRTEVVATVVAKASTKRASTALGRAIELLAAGAPGAG